MPGVILENLSGKKLFVLVVGLLLCQVLCFLVGALIAPTPSGVESILATKCIDLENNSGKWLYVRGIGRCHSIGFNESFSERHIQVANEVVFAFQLPSPKNNEILDYSRWQQNLIGILQFDVAYYPDIEMPSDVRLTMDVKMAYRNRGDAEDDWKHYYSSTVERHLHCSIVDKKAGYFYNCSLMPLLELGSLHHDFYLINIRLPVDEELKINSDVGHIEDLWLVAINQNGGFTKIWLLLKCVFLPSIILITIWFWNRVHQLQRSPVLLEYMLLSLGAALTFLNTPVEFSTLYVDMPFMPLFQDIRQGMFYAALMSFWLVFAGEHLMIQHPTPHHLRMYWKHLSAVAVGCLSLLIFDVCEKGAQAWNPFYSVWATDIGTDLALTFIICAGISSSMYFLFLCGMIWKVFRNISVKKASLPSMSSVRRLHYEGIIYRFKFLMLATLTCAAMTVTGFIMGQASEGRWKWDDGLQIEYTSGFFTGVYGMWNIYIFALIVLYAPSHKHWPSEADLNSSAGDEIKLSQFSNEPNEISLLTTFAQKTAND